MTWLYLIFFDTCWHYFGADIHKKMIVDDWWHDEHYRIIVHSSTTIYQPPPLYQEYKVFLNPFVDWNRASWWSSFPSDPPTCSLTCKFNLLKLEIVTTIDNRQMSRWKDTIYTRFPVLLSRNPLLRNYKNQDIHALCLVFSVVCKYGKANTCFCQTTGSVLRIQSLKTHLPASISPTSERGYFSLNSTKIVSTAEKWEHTRVGLCPPQIIWRSSSWCPGYLMVSGIFASAAISISLMSSITAVRLSQTTFLSVFRLRILVNAPHPANTSAPPLGHQWILVGSLESSL